MRILKFGGTSVAGPVRLRQVAGIVAAAVRRHEVAVVASAQAGVTDALVAAVDRRERAGLVEHLAARHLRGIEALGGPQAAAAAEAVRDRLTTLEALLGAEPANGEHAAWRDAVLATGERLSVHLVAAALAAVGLRARAVDAAELIVTDSGFGNANAQPAATRERALAWKGAWPDGTVPVITGFVGADPQGRTTTLGRGGSDTSAAVLGAALGARRIEIWTDVEGVLTAPPRIVPNAVPLPTLSFGVAREVALLGGKVLHPRTMEPAEAAGIPIVVRSTFAPQQPGTVVGPADRRTAHARVVTGLDGVALLSVPAHGWWSGGFGTPASRLQEAGITVLGFSRDEPSRVTVAVPQGETERAADLLAPDTDAASRVDRRADCCLVAVVGDGIAAGWRAEASLGDLLDRLHLPVVAVLRRSSPDAVVAVLRGHFLRRAIKALHGAVIAADRLSRLERTTHPSSPRSWGETRLAWQGGRP
ncbi:MAG: aspartate kinase [Thermoanaerobaculaceae bacterium]|jgi:aspartate kinase|nr:aspartate kinase [Thermoanaerobaculaceae bacterium]